MDMNYFERDTSKTLLQQAYDFLNHLNGESNTVTDIEIDHRTEDSMSYSFVESASSIGLTELRGVLLEIKTIMDQWNRRWYS